MLGASFFLVLKDVEVGGPKSSRLISSLVIGWLVYCAGPWGVIEFRCLPSSSGFLFLLGFLALFARVGVRMTLSS